MTNSNENNGFIVAKKALSSSDIELADASCLVKEANPKFIKSLIALNRLLSIAAAWNQADNFTPDFCNDNQTKWSPWFTYSDDAKRFVCTATDCSSSFVPGSLGSRLCFKTSARASQFGGKFIDLWNIFLLPDKKDSLL